MEDFSIYTGRVREFSIVDYVLFVVTMLVSASIGIFYAVWDCHRNTPEEFLLGGKKMNVVPVAMSLMVTFVSSLTLLGYPAEMYNYNTMFWYLAACFLLALPCAVIIFIPFFYNLGVTSTFEYLEMRFNKAVRVIGCMMTIMQTLLYMSFLLYAPSLALNAVTGVNLWGCVVGMGVVATFYTTLGGMKAVLWTDTFQAGVILAGLLTIIIRGVEIQGGMAHIWNLADNRSRIVFDEFSVDPRTRHSVWSMVLGGGAYWATLYGINQSQVQRCLSCPTVGKAKLSVLLSLPGLVVIVSLSCLLGVIMFAFYADCDPIKFGLVHKPDQLVPLYVMDILGTMDGLPGIFVSAVFSGSLSSISSGLNALAALTFKDIMEGFGWKSSSAFRSTIASKLLVAVYGLGAVGLAWIVSRLGGILQALYVVVGVFSGPVLGVFTLGMFFPWANVWGAIAGQLVSLVFLFWLGMGAFFNGLVTPMSPTSTLACNWSALAPPMTPLTFVNFTTITNATTTATPVNYSSAAEHVPDASVLEPLYRLSYMWYNALGMLVVWIVGLLVSFITGATDPKTLDARYIIPVLDVLFSCLPRSLRRRFYCGVRHGQEQHPAEKHSGMTAEERKKLFSSTEMQVIVPGYVEADESGDKGSRV